MIDFLTRLMTSHGYLALVILAFAEACCIPVPSEITFGFGGLLASQGRLSLTLVIVIGTVAEMGGSLTSYAIGRGGGRHLLDRHGKWVLVLPGDLDRAERLFAGRGAWAVAVMRALPIARCFGSFCAGVVGVRPAPFAVFSLIGTAAWATALTLVAYQLGPEFHSLMHSFSLPGIVLSVLLLAGLIAHRVYLLRQARYRGQAAAAGPAAPGEPPDIAGPEVQPAADIPPCAGPDCDRVSGDS